MIEKCACCDGHLNHVEELITGYCFCCIKKAKGSAAKNRDRCVKPIWEGENESELKGEIAGLSNQPRIIGLMKRLKCLGEAAE